MVDVIGTRLGRYEIKERIGRGGMATVYKARDVNLDRLVAIKVLHDHLADDADFKIRFEREAKNVALLNHPNIVQIFDFESEVRGDETIYYMVMPFINGPSLRAVMEQRRNLGDRLSMDEIEQVMASVCKALSYAHRQGIIHRDVTPSNILFNQDGGVVLADFGLARMVDGKRLTQTNMTTGTPLYMSPEQGIGELIDARSDIYSLGVVLFEMLAGTLPFEGDTAYAIIMKHVNEPLPLGRLPTNRVNPALEAVLLRALAKDQRDRFQDADVFLSEFQRAAMGQMDTAVRTGIGTIVLPIPSKRKNSEQTPLYLGGLAIVLLMGIVLAAFVRPALVNDKPAMVTLAVLPTIARPIGNSMTDSALMFNDDFATEKHSAWMISGDEPGIYRAFEESVLRLRNTLPATAITTIVNPRSAEYGRPVIIEASLTLAEKSQSPSATGIIFRYKSDDEYYVFAFDGQRRVSIWLRKIGVWTELRALPSGEQWTPDDAINPPGQKNLMRIEVNEELLTGYMNDKQVVQVTVETQIISGAVGIYLATTTNSSETQPVAEVEVNTYSVQPLNNPIPTAGPKG